MPPGTRVLAGRPAGCGGLAGAGLVVTCEHGGNRVPDPYRDLFHADQALLGSHCGYDPGALIMAQALAEALAAPLVVSTVSRLLVDLNRSIGHPRLHSEVIREASAEVRERILRRYYQPYRYPYAGKDDGLTTSLRRRFPADAYVGVELEINQKHVSRAGGHWTALRQVIVESLCRTLMSRCAGICA